MLTEREILRLASRDGRYQVITYSRDSGADDKMEYADKAVAMHVARSYVKGLGYNGAIVYDLRTRHTVYEYGYYADSARPREREQQAQ